MKRILQICFTVLLVLAYSAATPQSWKYKRKLRPQEIAFGIGASEFYGDLGGANKIGSNPWNWRDFDLPSVRPTLSLHYSYEIQKRMDIKTNLLLGYIKGNDQFTHYIYRERRNLMFRTPILEFSEQVDFYITKAQKKRTYYNLRSRSRRFTLENMPFSSYIFIGVGAFYFNPQAKYDDGKWYALKKYHTEGEGFVPTRKNYSLIQVSFPVGFGFKYPMSSGYSIGFEFTIHKTLTDYMDDCSTTYFDTVYLKQYVGGPVLSLADPSKTKYNTPWFTAPGSQRGDPRDKDFFMTAMFHLYYDISRLSKIRNFRF